MIEVPAGSILLSPADVRLLYEVCRIRDLRTRYRIGDSKAYALLNAITVARFGTVADNGVLPRQSAATEDRGTWTVREIAQASGRSERAVRMDCQAGQLTSTKAGRTWIIPTTAATTYIESRKRA